MLTAILIDDDESNISSMKEKLARHCPQVQVIAASESAKEAIALIENHKPDLVFLDIEMPVMNGFTLLQQIENRNFELIFVTAYDHYAIKAIRFSALDYLVKPVEPDELKAAVERAVQKRNHNVPNERLEVLLENLSNPKTQCKRIAIPGRDGLHFVHVADIVYLEASNNYTTIYTVLNEKHVASQTIKDFEETLPPEHFIRIHNSYIINKDFAQRYIRGEGGQVVLRNGVTLDVSKRKKHDFLKAIGN